MPGQDTKLVQTLSLTQTTSAPASRSVPLSHLKLTPLQPASSETRKYNRGQKIVITHQPTCPGKSGSFVDPNNEKCRVIFKRGLKQKTITSTCLRNSLGLHSRSPCQSPKGPSYSLHREVFGTWTIFLFIILILATKNLDSLTSVSLRLHGRVWILKENFYNYSLLPILLD